MFFSNNPFIGIDSDTFYIYIYFIAIYRDGYNTCNNNNIEENGKDYQRSFDTDSSALCPHFQCGRTQKGHCHTSPTFPHPRLSP